MFWLRGEGFGEKWDLAALQRCLGAGLSSNQLDDLVAEGFLIHRESIFQLSEKGLEEGRRLFGSRSKPS